MNKYTEKFSEYKKLRVQIEDEECTINYRKNILFGQINFLNSKLMEIIFYEFYS